jgi:twinkle protein
MIEDVKQALAAEEKRLEMPKSIVMLDQMTERMIDFKNNEERDTGDKMRWVNVELVLKPEIYLLTGIPSMGKSTFMDNVLINSIDMHNYKWAVFSPESHPLEEHLKQLLEINLRTSFFGRYGTQAPSDEMVARAIKQMSNNIFMLNPSDNEKDIDSMLEVIGWLVENCGVNAFLLDPYNEFSHTRPTGESETEYVSRFLGKVRGFVNQYNVMAWIVAHPTKLRKEDYTAADGTVRQDYNVPTAYDVAGSANFFNKPDVIVAFHRDKSKDTNPENICEVVVQKVRRKSTGTMGTYLLKYNYINNTFSSYGGDNSGY